MKLTPYFRTPEKDFEDQEISFKRSQSHWDDIQKNFIDLDMQCSLMMDNLGKDLIRAFVYCPTDITDKDTRKAIHWMKSYYGNVERNFRENEGRFFWRSKTEIEDEFGKYEFMLFLENTHPLTCEIKKVTKQVEVFESVCK